MEVSGADPSGPASSRSRAPIDSGVACSSVGHRGQHALPLRGQPQSARPEPLGERRVRLRARRLRRCRVLVPHAASLCRSCGRLRAWRFWMQGRIRVQGGSSAVAVWRDGAAVAVPADAPGGHRLRPGTRPRGRRLRVGGGRRRRHAAPGRAPDAAPLLGPPDGAARPGRRRLARPSSTRSSPTGRPDSRASAASSSPAASARGCRPPRSRCWPRCPRRPCASARPASPWSASASASRPPSARRRRGCSVARRRSPTR